MSTKKFSVLDQLVKASKVVSNGAITLIGTTKDGRKLGVTYTEGCTLSGLTVFRVDAAGRYSRIRVIPTGVDMRARFVRDGQQILAGEIICQLERLADGMPICDCEYNHIFPVAYWDKVGYIERFGLSHGELVNSYNNKLHWGLCEQIREQTGYLVEISCYSPIYRYLLGLKLITDRTIRACEKQGFLRILGREEV